MGIKMDSILHYKLPLTGNPEEVIASLEEIISSFIKKSKVEYFYIGQSINLKDTKAHHGCDAVVELYQSKDADDVRNIEFRLMKKFYQNPKNYNLKAESGEAASFSAMNYLYLALWFQ